MIFNLFEMKNFKPMEITNDEMLKESIESIKENLAKLKEENSWPWSILEKTLRV